MTTFADGLYQNGGVPVGVNPVYNKIFYNQTASYKKGRAWFVDPSYGGNGNGRTPQTAFSTMDRAFDSLHSGDIIYALGNITEQLVTPDQIFDVTIIGCGNRPRNADSTPAGGQYGAVTWKAPSSGTAAQATLRIVQQGWTIQNILFNMIDANAAGIEIVRNAASGNSERDGSHASIIGCRFAGAGKGIRFGATSFTENPFNVLIAGCKFNGCTFGIHGPSGCQPNGIEIYDSFFMASTNAITAQLQASLIKGNTIMGFTAAANSGGIDLNGGIAGNCITLNYLGGTYSIAGGYRGAGAADEWAGNMNVIAGGWTAADPA